MHHRAAKAYEVSNDLVERVYALFSDSITLREVAEGFAARVSKFHHNFSTTFLNTLQALKSFNFLSILLFSFKI